MPRTSGSLAAASPGGGNYEYKLAEASGCNPKIASDVKKFNRLKKVEGKKNESESEKSSEIKIV